MSPSSPLEEHALERIMQAVNAIEQGTYNPAHLSDLLDRVDDLGQLARVIDAMGKVVTYRDLQLKLLRKVVPIGVALSAEKDFNRLLESLVVEAGSVTGADAGTLYLLEDNALRFVIVRNASLNINTGGSTGNEITFNPVPLYNPDGSENRANIASYSALTHQKIAIADAYETSAGFDFSGTKAFDKNTGYRSKSFLTIPLEGKEKQVIGVLQLINAKDPHSGEIVPFSSDDVLDILVLLASEALDAYIREEKLREEIAELRIKIDLRRRDSQVAEITDTQYFKNLKDRAKGIRTERKDK